MSQIPENQTGIDMSETPVEDLVSEIQMDINVNDMSDEQIQQKLYLRREKINLMLVRIDSVNLTGASRYVRHYLISFFVVGILAPIPFVIADMFNIGPRTLNGVGVYLVILPIFLILGFIYYRYTSIRDKKRAEEVESTKLYLRNYLKRIDAVLD